MIEIQLERLSDDTYKNKFGITSQEAGNINELVEVFDQLRAADTTYNDLFMGSATGSQWLNHQNLQNNGEAACWLETTQGREWLDSETGQKRLKEAIIKDIDNPTKYEDNALSWWLATPQGGKWLQSKEGVEFLGTDIGTQWLQKTDAAAVWLGTPEARDSPWSKTDIGEERLKEAHQAPVPREIPTKVSHWNDENPVDRLSRSYLRQKWPQDIIFVTFPKRDSEVNSLEPGSEEAYDSGGTHE